MGERDTEIILCACKAGNKTKGYVVVGHIPVIQDMTSHPRCL